ncbi:MAG: PilZ domain-containing protein [Candidatus Omnitrophica bacterium]|nr:PilZ domain-containing protein [Candidatus Omnitrophota bacterium]
MPKAPEKRQYERYDTELKVYFHHTYDIRTKVRFQLFDRLKKKAISQKYSALSKNVSAEGISFVSSHPPKKGDYLNLEVYLPTATQPVVMEGEVRWSRLIARDKEGKVFQTGVLLKKVNNNPIHDTIYFDEEYHIHWSNVLESVLGKYKSLAKNK